MKIFITVLLLAIANAVHAEPMEWNDRWTGADKTTHFIVGMTVGGAVTAYTENPTYGALAGCGVGLLKEVYDMTGRGSPSAQDAFASCIGAYLGSKVVEGLFLTPNSIGYTFKF